MVTRLYFCKNCDHEFETYQPMNEKLKTKCPECKKNTLAQDITGFHGAIRQYKTLGSIAEKNTRELGSAGVDRKMQELNQREESLKKQRSDKLEKAGYKPLEKKNNPLGTLPALPKNIQAKLNSNDEKGIERYIREGK